MRDRQVGGIDDEISFLSCFLGGVPVVLCICSVYVRFWACLEAIYTYSVDASAEVHFGVTIALE